MDLFDNPLGLDGFEFVEFTGPDTEDVAPGPIAGARPLCDACADVWIGAVRLFGPGENKEMKSQSETHGGRRRREFA